MKLNNAGGLTGGDPLSQCSCLSHKGCGATLTDVSVDHWPSTKTALIFTPLYTYIYTIHARPLWLML